MKNNFKPNKTSFGAAFLLTITLSTMACTSNIDAKALTMQSNEGNNKVRIYHEESNETRVYEVNGKKFNWKDLTPEQQQQISKIEKKIQKIETRLKFKEKEMQPIIKKLEANARKIEKEMEKFELVTIKVEKATVNRHDLEMMMQKVEALAQINEKEMSIIETEMHKLDKQLRTIDLSFVKEIDQHVDELKKVLVAVADELE